MKTPKQISRIIQTMTNKRFQKLCIKSQVIIRIKCDFRMILTPIIGHILHKSILSTAKKKRGSFSLFMGARRQFEEMPNKKVKSGSKKVLLYKYNTCSSEKGKRRRETSKDCSC